jgi:hypothetical protein
MASGPGTSLLENRLEKLNVAAGLHGFDRALTRSARGSIGWGVFSLVIAALIFASGGFGWINLILGSLLVVEGVYEMRAREPRVIKVSAATLGALAVWNLGSIAVAYYYLHTLVGASVWAGILQAVGAWTTYRSYAFYAELLRQSDPATNEELAMLLQHAKTADPALDPNLVEFKVKNLTDPLQLWKIIRIDARLLLFVQSEEILKVVKFAITCCVVEKQEMRLEIVGEKMFGQDQKAVIHLSEGEIKNVIISPAMATKLQTF